MNQLIYFFAAIRFFTRLPVPAWVGHSAEQLDRSARYFPLVGIIIGALGAATTSLAAQIWPVPLAVALGMIATLLATGAFHEDGLADAADGFGGGWSKERILAIMKDSRIGSFGTVALVMALLVKWTALSALAGQSATRLWPILIAGHAVSRLASTALIYRLEYVRDDADGKAKPLARHLNAGELALAAGFGLAPCLFLPYPATLLALALAGLVAWRAAGYFVRRIGGYTGDCLGAAQQLAELAFYLGLLGQWNFG